MNKYTLSSLFLVLFILNANTLVMASDPDKLEGSLIRSSNLTLGPSLDDVPRICTLELQMQEPFRKVDFKIVPKKFKNANQSYLLDEQSIPEYFEEKAKKYLTEKREKQNAWRVKQNGSKELKPYISKRVENGELDKINGSKQAFNWMTAQILEIGIVINRLNNLLGLIQREYNVKRQIIECYKRARTENQSESYFNWRSYGVAWYNYNFNAAHCRALSDIYGFKFRPTLTDEQSRAAFQKREAFVFSIPKSHTPETLPKMTQVKRETSQKEPMSQDVEGFKPHYEEFVRRQQEEDQDFSMALLEFINFQDFTQHFPPSEKQESINKKIIDFDYEKAAKQYRVYSDYLEFTKYDSGLEVEPKEYIKYASFLQIMAIALSYEDYLNKVALREDLKAYIKKKGRTPANPLGFTETKKKLHILIETYQGKKQNSANSLLSQYLALHQKIAELDKELIQFGVMDFSLYELAKYERYLRPLPSTTETVVKRPLYVVRDDFEHWQDVGMIDEPAPLPVEIRLVLAEEARIKRQKEKAKPKPEPKVLYTEEVKQLPKDTIEKTIKFIKQAYQDFNTKVFMLGLTRDQAIFLQEGVGSDVAQGHKPVQINGREWIFSLAPITAIDLSGQLLVSPDIAPRKDASVKGRIEARFKAYQGDLEEHRSKIAAFEKEVTSSIKEVKSLREMQNLAVATLSVSQFSSQSSAWWQQSCKELRVLQKKLEEERNNDSVLESEQLSIVDTLSRLFSNSEVLPLAQDAQEDEETSSLKRLTDEAKKLKNDLERRGRKADENSQEKKELEIAVQLLSNVSSVVEHLQIIKNAQKEIMKIQTDISDKNWVLHFYAHLQAMPWEQQQRIKISFQPIQDVNKVDQNENRVVHLMEAAYSALFTDIFEQSPPKGVSIGSYKLNDNQLGLMIDLEDLKAPSVTSLMPDKA